MPAYGHPKINPTHMSPQTMVRHENTPNNKMTPPFLTSRFQEVCGILLYYARAVDCTMLAALGSIVTQQASPTANTMIKIKQLLDYDATHPDAAVTYRSSNMVLAAHSSASYLSETKLRSRAGGHFFMASNIAVPENNGAVHTVTQIIKTVMSSAAEAELGALYINCREAIPAQHLLEAMVHRQPPTAM